MSRIRLIHHVNVPISNPERTREWYETVLEQ
jgi:catechol 2,3-dioxygenase-like lactoylglutathione lyase family enzyme